MPLLRRLLHFVAPEAADAAAAAATDACLADGCHKPTALDGRHPGRLVVGLLAALAKPDGGLPSDEAEAELAKLLLAVDLPSIPAWAPAVRKYATAALSGSAVAGQQREDAALALEICGGHIPNRAVGALARLSEDEGVGRPGRVISRKGGDVWLLGAGGTTTVTKVAAAEAEPVAWPSTFSSLLGPAVVIRAVQEHLTAIQLTDGGGKAARWDSSWLALLALRNCQTALDGDPALAAEIATGLVSGGLLPPLMDAASSAGVAGPMADAIATLETTTVDLLGKVREVVRAGGVSYAYESSSSGGETAPPDMSYLDAIELDAEWDVRARPAVLELQVLNRPELATELAVVQAVYAACDADSNGKIELSELASKFPKQGRHLFEVFDIDGDGQVTLDEFVLVLDRKYSADAEAAAKFVKFLCSPTGVTPAAAGGLARSASRRRRGLLNRGGSKAEAGVLDSITLDSAAEALVQTLSAASAGQLRYLNQPDFAKELAVANSLFDWCDANHDGTIELAALAQKIPVQGRNLLLQLQPKEPLPAEDSSQVAEHSSWTEALTSSRRPVVGSASISRAEFIAALDLKYLESPARASRFVQYVAGLIEQAAPRGSDVEAEPASIDYSAKFNQYDANGDGVLDMTELRAMMLELGFERPDDDYLRKLVRISPGDSVEVVELAGFQFLWRHLGLGDDEPESAIPDVDEPKAEAEAEPEPADEEAIALDLQAAKEQIGAALGANILRDMLQQMEGCSAAEQLVQLAGIGVELDLPSAHARAAPPSEMPPSEMPPAGSTVANGTKNSPDGSPANSPAVLPVQPGGPVIPELAEVAAEVASIVESNADAIGGLAGRAAFMQAKTRFAEKKYTESIALYSRAQATDFDRGVCFNQLALCFVKLDQREKSAALYRAAVDAGTDRHTDAFLWYNNMRTNLEKLNMTAEAIIACRKVIELSPTTSNGRAKNDAAKRALMMLERALLKSEPLEIPEIMPESKADRGEWIVRSKKSTEQKKKKKVDITVAVPVLAQIESTASEVNGLGLALLCLGRCVAAKLAVSILARLPAATPPLFSGPDKIRALLGFCELGKKAAILDATGFDAIVANICSTVVAEPDTSALSEPEPESLPSMSSSSSLAKTGGWQQSSPSANMDYLVDSMLSKAKLQMVESAAAANEIGSEEWVWDRRDETQMFLEDDGNIVRKRDGRGPDYSGCVGNTIFEKGEHTWELKIEGEMSGVWIGVSDPDISVDRHFSDCCPPGSVFFWRPDGELGNRGPLQEGTTKESSYSGRYQSGHTIRFTLNLDEGTLKFFNVTEDKECGGFTGIAPGTVMVPYINFDYSTTGTIVERSGMGGGRPDQTPIDIAVAVLSSFARGHFAQTSSRLLAAPTMSTLTACMYGTKGETRRQIIRLVSEILDGAERHAVSGLPASTFAGVLKLFEQCYAEANNKTDPSKSDKFGNESLALLSNLVVRLAKFGAVDAAVLGFGLSFGPVKSAVTFTASGDRSPAVMTNDEGAAVKMSQQLYYCGRQLGREAIPNSDGGCGPTNGPQCASCKRFAAPKPIKVTLKAGQGGKQLAWCLPSGVPLMDGITELALEVAPPSRTDAPPRGGGSPSKMQLVASVGKRTPKPPPPPPPPPPPSPSERMREGDKCRLAAGVTEGCLQPGEIGTVIKVDEDDQPYHVQKADGSGSYWYRVRQLVKVDESPASEPAAEEPAAEAAPAAAGAAPPAAKEITATIDCSKDKLEKLLTDIGRMAAVAGVTLTGDGWPDFPERDVKEAAKKACPNGHELTAYTTPSGRCDGCRKDISSPTHVMDCRQCNWWLCSDCTPVVNLGAPACPSCSTKMVWTSSSATGYNGFGCDLRQSGRCNESGDRWWCGRCRADICEHCHAKPTGGGDAYEGLDMHRHPLGLGSEESFECDMCNKQCNERCHHCRDCRFRVCATCWADGAARFKAATAGEAKPSTKLELAKLDLVQAAMVAIKAGGELPLPLRLRLGHSTTARLGLDDLTAGMSVICVEVPPDYPVKLANAKGTLQDPPADGGYAVVSFDGDIQKLVPSVLTSAEQVGVPDTSAAWAGYATGCFSTSGGGGGEAKLPVGYVAITGQPWTQDEYLALVGLLAKNPSIEQLPEEELLAQAGRTPLLSRSRPEILDYAVVLRRLGKLVFDASKLMDESGWFECRDFMLAPAKTAALWPILNSLKSTFNGSAPRIQVDRGRSVDRENSEADGGEWSVLFQVFKSLDKLGKARTADIFRGAPHEYNQWWYTEFAGETGIDQGGLFRTTISDINDELTSAKTPLFIPTPNQRADTGDLRHCWMPNPACHNLQMFEFVGRLMAGAIQSDENIVVPFPPYIWRKFAGAPCTESQYCKGIDESVANYSQMTAYDEETFEMSFFETLAVVRSDGSEQELVPGGADIDVTFATAADFVSKATACRMAEVDEQCAAIRAGMLSAMIPGPVLALWTENELALAVGGVATITTEALKRSVSSFDASSEVKEMFWKAVEAMTQEERAAMLKFITGRTRFPVQLKIDSGSTNSNNYFPECHTCFQQIILPPYPDWETMLSRINIASANCGSVFE